MRERCLSGSGRDTSSPWHSYGSQKREGDLSLPSRILKTSAHLAFARLPCYTSRLDARCRGVYKKNIVFDEEIIPK